MSSIIFASVIGTCKAVWELVPEIETSQNCEWCQDLNLQENETSQNSGNIETYDSISSEITDPNFRSFFMLDAYDGVTDADYSPISSDDQLVDDEIESEDELTIEEVRQLSENDFNEIYDPISSEITDPNFRSFFMLDAYDGVTDADYSPISSDDQLADDEIESEDELTIEEVRQLSEN